MKSVQPFPKSRLLFPIWVCCCLFLLAMPTQTAVSQTPPPLTEDAFWQLIADTQTAVQAMHNELPESQREQLNTLAAALMNVTAVSRSDGQVMSVNLTFFTTQLLAESPDLDRIAAQLQTLLDMRRRWPDAQFDGSETAVLDTILARPEFQYETAEPTWLTKQWQALLERLQAFLNKIFPANNRAEGSGAGSTILTLVLSLIVAAILVYILKDLITDLAGEARLAADNGTNGEPLTAEAALQRAQTFSGAGDYRTAIRYLYLSALLLLEERNLLRYDRALTNREYLRSIAHRPELSAILRDIIDVFDRVWYGFQTVDEPTYQRYVQQVSRLKQQRGSE